MLVFRLQSQTQSEVKRVFDYLLAGLGSQLFSTLFEVILTDYAEEKTMPKFFTNSYFQPMICVSSA